MFEPCSLVEMEERGFRDAVTGRRYLYPFIVDLFPDLEDGYSAGYQLGYWFSSFLFFIRLPR